MAFDYNNYTELAYIESTGTQYIDTGFNPINIRTTFRLETEMQFVSVNVDEETLFGSGWRSSATNPTVLNFFCGRSSSKSTDNYTVLLGTTLGAYSQDSGVAIDLTDFSNFAFDGSTRGFTINGSTTTAAGNINTFNNTNMSNIWLFAMPNTGSSGTRMAPARFSSARLKSFTVTNEGETLLNLIPAKRNYDGAIGLFDTVNEGFLANLGTGTFLYGELPTSDNIYVYDNGTWKKGKPYVYDNGTWKTGKPYVYDNGTWKS